MKKNVQCTMCFVCVCAETWAVVHTMSELSVHNKVIKIVMRWFQGKHKKKKQRKKNAKVYGKK